MAMLLVGYITISYMWEYDHISKKSSLPVLPFAINPHLSNQHTANSQSRLKTCCVNEATDGLCGENTVSHFLQVPFDILIFVSSSPPEHDRWRKYH